MFGKAKWIWLNKDPEPNEYADFSVNFNYSGGKVVLKLCAETDYIVYLNGKPINHCQFAGYRNEKYYDEDDITKYCLEGENALLITVRYEGITTFCHIEDGAGLIFSLECDGKQIEYSSENTLGRLSPNYVHHFIRLITDQLGATSTMTNRGEACEYAPCREVNICDNFKKRPVKRIVDLAPTPAKSIDINGRKIYDLGKEDCGYVYLRVNCKKATDIKVAYGEHIVDGCVRYLIGPRDFSLDFECAEGENYFEQYFVRVAGRYLEVFADDSAEILEIGIIPTIYPITEKPCRLEGIEKQIYDVSVRTLRLCMHTHYEDCPWREQSLYTLDSRNQMLFGYYAFEETDFARENLVFMSKGKLPDGMLEITYPTENSNVAIPFFSVHLPVAVYEYIEHTNDLTIVPEVIDSMIGILKCLYSWRDGTGLITNQGKPYWNFYEWSDGNEGRKGFGMEGTHDLLINCAFVHSCSCLEKICKMSGYTMPEFDTEAIKKAIVENFLNRETGLYNNCLENEIYTVIGNTFAMMIGLGTEQTLKALKGEYKDAGVVPATLSMLAFVYDMILEHDKENGQAFVLEDITKNYTYMLSKGATSFWETIKGEADFHNAGSLCHGWSAIPIYYYNRFYNDKFN